MDEQLFLLGDLFVGPLFPPCTCCGDRCNSQLESAEDGIWPMCGGCDPNLDEFESDWLCPCRRARGDANWARIW